MKILLSLSYLGGAYCGFQVQKNGISVQACIQDALETLYGERLAVQGCSRTDAGVHARDFRLTFDPGVHTGKIPLTRLSRALNAVLPPDISVFSCVEVSPSFHVRYDVKEKEYEYRIYNAPARSPFEEGRSWHCSKPLDADAMNQAAGYFIGTHDFTSFTSAGAKEGSRVRTVFAASVTRDGDIVSFRIAADGFLYNMVRIMMGTIVRCGENTLLANEIPAILAACDRRAAGKTAPPQGLYLNRVQYSL